MSPNVPAPAAPQAREFNPVAWWSTIAGICAVIAFGSIFVTTSYLKKREQELANPRPGYLAKLSDFTAVNRDGATVSLSELEGKIWVAGYQYTGCPAGCLGLAAVMSGLHERFGGSGAFHLVSVSVDPAEDTPEAMDAWVKERGVDVSGWWFLTGDEQAIREYMIRDFKFFGVTENTDPAVIASQGRYSHDQRLALVDGQGHVRGFYDVMNPELGSAHLERLARDIGLLHAEAGLPLP